MNIFEELERDLGYLVHRDQYARRGTRELAPIIDALIAPSQAPAAMPVNLKTGHPEGDPVSLATDIESGFSDLAGKLPQLLADAKKLEGSPLAQVAITAGEHLASGILPVEAVASVARIAGAALDEYVALYAPQPAPAAAQ